MPYAELTDITIAFATDQWDPTADGFEPSSAQVAAMLASESSVLDGELAALVTVPVTTGDSPNLHAICRQIVALRVRADVYDTLYKPLPPERADTRQSAVWRGRAESMLKRILAGVTADGLSLGKSGSESPGAAVGSFGASPWTTGGGW